MNELLEQFLLESRELVEQATSDLLVLDQAPDDIARLDSVFRAFHTLKGAAGIVDFDAMGRVMHAAEDFLAAVRIGDASITAELVTQCLACLDQVSQWLAAMEEAGEPPGDAATTASSLLATFTRPDAPPPDDPPVAAETPPAWLGALRARYAGAAITRTALLYLPAPECFFRGEDPLELISRLPGLLALDVQPRRPWPAPAALDPFACNLVVHALSSCSTEEVASHLSSVRDHVEIHALAAQDGSILPERAVEVLRAQMALLATAAGDGFAGRVGSAGRVAGNVLRHLGLEAKATEVDAALAASLSGTTPDALLASLEGVLDSPAAAPYGVAPARHDPVIRALRVDLARIDALVSLAGELTVVKNSIGHTARLAGEGGDRAGLAQALKAQHAKLDQLTAALQQSVLQIRVLPLRHVFQRFARLVREMAASMGKAVRLVIEGETTEADKAVVEVLFEPLLHAVRNAVDHGVENPQQRAAAGKHAMAVVRLRGFREGEHVIIEVTDDGRGIDAAKVRRIAADRRLVPPDALATLSDDEVVDLIFAPGFSTASSVTDISGRGVGMDAARSAVERIGGRVSVHSRLGEGTTVRFVLPFTVMVSRVMTVEAGGQVFGVPFEAVVETLQAARDGIRPIGAAEVFVLRGRTVPLVSLAEALGLPGTDIAGAPLPTVNAVVTEVGGQLSALAVDRFGERLDVMLKPMDGLLAGMTGIAGTTLLADGRVLIVLDLQELLQ